MPAALLPALAQASVLRVAPDVLQAWLAPAAGQQLQDHLYLVDPMGNWMMRFPKTRRAGLPAWHPRRWRRRSHTVLLT